MTRFCFLAVAIFVCVICQAQNVTVRAVDRPVAEVFRSIARQTGKNFVYASALLKNVRVSVNVKDKPFEQALAALFKDTGIEYEIKGKNIILRKKHRHAAKLPERRHEQQYKPNRAVKEAPDVPKMLEEVVVVSRLETPVVESVEIGTKKLSADEIADTPVLFGESDVLKTLQMQPGITGGAEGMAEIHVHGGNSDENLFMLDNVPIYHVNHLLGLFSAFNADAIRYIDFYKSSIPAKYDGRLSSYVDVRTKNGSVEGHQGSFKLGLTSGSFYMDGPVGSRTSYSVGLRRSWFDVLSVPLLAIGNSSSGDEKIRFRYAFMDFNCKVMHRFDSRAEGFLSFYFGDDILKTGSKDNENNEYGWYEDDTFDMHWGNLVAQAGFNYKFKPGLTSEFTVAYTRFFSDMKHDYMVREKLSTGVFESNSVTDTHNNINDWILRGDFRWSPGYATSVRFGASYTFHSFLPARTSRRYVTGSTVVSTRDSTWAYAAGEANLYVEDEWMVTDKFRLNAGIHGSIFHISGNAHFGCGPRLSMSWQPDRNWAVKAAYCRTNQYVHQLSRTYLSLPTDQWVPVTGDLKPQIADKVSLGAYWQLQGGSYTMAVEGYLKQMYNLVDYRDEYYLQPPLEMWNARLCSGEGTAKGVDLKIEKTTGSVTGHVSYSLGWADRTFAEKNGGHSFPARFDQRHAINVMLNWQVNDKVQLNAAWTGHSGNRFTLLPQVWDSPDFEDSGYAEASPLKTDINNYRLPFYHRLDVSCTVKNRRGFWTVSLYNAYCHLNTVAIRRAYDNWNRPVFQKVRMVPLIPSISYTWQF